MSDINSIILDKFYNRITQDSTMENIFGEAEIAISIGQAPPDSLMPYLVHKCDFRDAGEGSFPIRRGSYTIDIWTQSGEADLGFQIRNRLIELLDRYQFEDEDLSLDWIDIQSDGLIPDAPGIWHYTMLFNFRIYRKAETAYIVNRIEEQGGYS